METPSGNPEYSPSSRTLTYSHLRDPPSVQIVATGLQGHYSSHSDRGNPRILKEHRSLSKLGVWLPRRVASSFDITCLLSGWVEGEGSVSAEMSRLWGTPVEGKGFSPEDSTTGSALATRGSPSVLGALIVHVVSCQRVLGQANPL